MFDSNPFLGYTEIFLIEGESCQWCLGFIESWFSYTRVLVEIELEILWFAIETMRFEVPGLSSIQS